MNVNELLQRVIIEALENGAYSVEDIRENVEAAIERHEQYTADADN